MTPGTRGVTAGTSIDPFGSTVIPFTVTAPALSVPARLPAEVGGDPEPIPPARPPMPPPIAPNANACCAQSAIAPVATKRAVLEISLFFNIVVFYLFLFVL